MKGNDLYEVTCILNTWLYTVTVILSSEPSYRMCYSSICQACYGDIKRYLKGNSRKNENYLARFMEFFKTQVGMVLNAEEVMIEMVEDNR